MKVCVTDTNWRSIWETRIPSSQKDCSSTVLYNYKMQEKLSARWFCEDGRTDSLKSNRYSIKHIDNNEDSNLILAHGRNRINYYCFTAHLTSWLYYLYFLLGHDKQTKYVWALNLHHFIVTASSRPLHFIIQTHKYWNEGSDPRLDECILLFLTNLMILVIC